MIKVSDFRLNADDLQKRFTRRMLAKEYNFPSREGRNPYVPDGTCADVFRLQRENEAL